MLSDPLPRLDGPPSTARLTVAELRNSIAFRKRWGWVGCIAGGLAAVLWTLGTLSYFQIDTDAPATAAGVMTLTVAFLLQLAVTLLVARRIDARLRCPHCRRSLTPGGGLAIASGHCPHCGWNIVVRPHC